MLNNIDENTDEVIDNWLEQWRVWIDLLLEAGIVNIPSSIVQKIEQWAAGSEIIGFVQQAEMAKQLIENGASIELRADTFYKLLSECEVINRLYEAENIERSIQDEM